MVMWTHARAQAAREERCKAVEDAKRYVPAIYSAAGGGLTGHVVGGQGGRDPSGSFAAAAAGQAAEGRWEEAGEQVPTPPRSLLGNESDGRTARPHLTPRGESVVLFCQISARKHC